MRLLKKDKINLGKRLNEIIKQITIQFKNKAKIVK